MKFFKANCCEDDVVLIQVNSFNDFNINNIDFIANKFLGIGANSILIFDNNNEFKIFNSNKSELVFCESSIACFTKFLNAREKAMKNEITEDKTLYTKLGKISIQNLKNDITSIEIPRNLNLIKQEDCYIIEDFKAQLNYKFFITEDCKKINLDQYKDKKLIISFISNNDNFWKIRTIKPNESETFACCSTAFAAYKVINFLGYKNIFIKYNNKTIAYKSELNKIFQIAETKIVAEIKFFDQVLKEAI